MGIRAFANQTGKRSGHRMPGSGGVSYPTAVFLPTVSVAPSSAHGVRSMRSAYTGPLLRVQRTDTAQMDVPQRADKVVDRAAVAAWANGQEVRITTAYDQIGSKNYTETNWAVMPLFDASGQYGQAAAMGAFPAIVMDGWFDVVAGNVRRPRSCKVDI